MKKFDLQCSSCGATTRAHQNGRSYCVGCGKPLNADACQCGAWIPHYEDLPRGRHCNSCGSDAQLIKGTTAIPIGIYQTVALTLIIGCLGTVYLNRFWPGSPPTLILHSLDQAQSDALKWIISHPAKANGGMALLLFWSLQGCPWLWAGLYAFLFGSRGRRLVHDDRQHFQLLYNALHNFPRVVRWSIHSRRRIRAVLRKVRLALRENCTP